MPAAEIPWEDIFNDYLKGEWRIDRTGRYHHDFSIEELAEKYDCSPNTIYNYSSPKQNNWKKKKEIYLASVRGDNNFYTQMGAALAGDVISIANEIIQELKEEIYEKKTPGARGKVLDPTQRRLNNVKSLEVLQKIVNGIIKIQIDRVKESDFEANGSIGLSSEARRKEIERLTKIVNQQRQG